MDSSFIIMNNKIDEFKYSIKDKIKMIKNSNILSKNNHNPTPYQEIKFNSINDNGKNSKIINYIM